MENPILSVIIPTHKRPEILRKCLDHIEKQTIWDQLEVIVVSDGHDSETSALMTNGKSLRNVKFFEVPKSQQGVARNKGVREARGKYVMFIGDDIFLAPDACEKHLRIHSFTPNPSSNGGGVRAERAGWRAVLGFTTWDPACGITPVMKWLEKTGWQFGYPAIRPFAHSTIPPSIQHRFTYTSHISLPMEIARKFPFREDVTLYGWEDIEWGARLRDAGVKLFYEPDAKALHHHHITLEDSLKRMETLGKTVHLVPERVPTGWKLWKYRIAALLPTMRGMHAKAFLRGLTSARRSIS